MVMFKFPKIKKKNHELENHTIVAKIFLSFGSQSILNVHYLL